jgi:hypothetical protein
MTDTNVDALRGTRQRHSLGNLTSYLVQNSVPYLLAVKQALRDPDGRPIKRQTHETGQSEPARMS